MPGHVHIYIYIYINTLARDFHLAIHWIDLRNRIYYKIAFQGLVIDIIGSVLFNAKHYSQCYSQKLDYLVCVPRRSKIYTDPSALRTEDLMRRFRKPKTASRAAQVAAQFRPPRLECVVPLSMSMDYNALSYPLRRRLFLNIWWAQPSLFGHCERRTRRSLEFTGSTSTHTHTYTLSSLNQNI